MNNDDHRAKPWPELGIILKVEFKAKNCWILGIVAHKFLPFFDIDTICQLFLSLGLLRSLKRYLRGKCKLKMKILYVDSFLQYVI